VARRGGVAWREGGRSQFVEPLAEVTGEHGRDQGMGPDRLDEPLALADPRRAARRTNPLRDETG
jgi:hypothetical protein